MFPIVCLLSLLSLLSVLYIPQCFSLSYPYLLFCLYLPHFPTPSSNLQFPFYLDFVGSIIFLFLSPACILDCFLDFCVFLYLCPVLTAFCFLFSAFAFILCTFACWTEYLFIGLYLWAGLQSLPVFLTPRVQSATDRLVRVVIWVLSPNTHPDNEEFKASSASSGKWAGLCCIYYQWLCESWFIS